MIKPALDQLYLYALLFDAPPKIKEVVFQKMELDENWNDLCLTAEQLALNGENAKEESQRLHSIFSIISLESGQISPNQEYTFNPDPLVVSESHFPRKMPVDYKKEVVWDNFIREFKKLEKPEIDRRSGEFVLQLLFKHTSTIPCDRKGYATVSFYDLARLRAGISVALLPGDDSSSAGEVLLVGGDISGIQRFLYDIVSKNASRNLKGRSFYLDLLVNNTIEALLDKLQLYTANVAFDSGGNFLLITPNTEEVRREITVFEELLSSRLFAEHRTLITCSIGTSVLSETSSLSAAFSHISEQQTAKKNKPYLSKVQEYAELFEPAFVEEGGQQARDVITGEEIPDEGIEDTWYFDPDYKDDLKQANPTQQEVGENLITTTTAVQIILGQRLKQFDYWIKSAVPLLALNDLYIQKDVHIEVLRLGVYHYLLTEKELNQHWSKLEDQTITVIAINNFSLPNQAIPANWQWGFHMYGGNQGPTVYLEKLNRKDKCVPKTFSEMAGALEADRITNAHKNYEDSELSFKRLGVLRMDVDNLGQIFQRGIPAEKYCLATYCNLSRSMDFFFKGYLNELWEKDDRNKHTQIIYAGGDDLFVVGRWDKVFDLAYDIKTAFSAWTTYNSSISISGGMVMVTHKYPVMKAASMAGEAEDKSKAFEFETKAGVKISKNAFSLFDYPLRWSEIPDEERWSDEFALLLKLTEKLKNQLAGYGKTKGLPISVLRNIYALNELQQARKGQNNLAWQWQTAYTFSQMEQRLAKEQAYEGEKLFREIKQGILLGIFDNKQFKDGNQSLQLLAMVARLAELDRRTNNEPKPQAPSCQ